MDALDLADLPACTRCELSTTRRRVVVGSGPRHAALVVVGEAPGAREDEGGEPFVGRSGQLLFSLLASELGLNREECFVTNVVKCRPPLNRTPRALEVATCRAWLDLQLSAVSAPAVLALGNVASRALFRHELPMATVHGRVQRAGKLSGVATYHPAAALRGGARVLETVRADLAVLADLLTVARRRTESAEATQRAGEQFAALLRPGDVVLLSGRLGAGKTTFVQGVARGLGVSERVTSPTFTLVRQHQCRNPWGIVTLHHGDIYRVNGLGEVRDLDLAELVEESAVALVEWGDVAAEVFGRDVMRVDLFVEGDDARTLSVSGYGARTRATSLRDWAVA